MERFATWLGLPLHVAWTMAIVFSGIFIITLGYRLGKGRRFDPSDELYLRIRSWWVMIGLTFVLLFIGQVVAIIGVAFLSFLALKEFFSIVPMRIADRRAIFWAYLSIPLQYWWVVEQWYGMFLVFIPVYVFLFLPLRLVLIGVTDGFIKSAAVIYWGLMLTVFSLSHVAYLMVLPAPDIEWGFQGPVLLLLLLTGCNDVFQYVFGKLFGKRRVVPQVSPGKTWAGLLGGVVGCSILAFLLGPLLSPFSGLQAVLLGGLLAVVGFIGDVVISALKRDLQLKDSGTLIPGHGGLLDRLDSLTFTAPVFFHLLFYFCYDF